MTRERLDEIYKELRRTDLWHEGGDELLTELLDAMDDAIEEIDRLHRYAGELEGRLDDFALGEEE